ncbi:MAG: SMC-Scp complex subunit ScpB [Clostridia bacterium]|nr:SMC-Scp complex subunit ScpB [Clostridia bacterium]
MSFNTDSIIESILFAAGESVSRKELADILEMTEEEIIKAVDRLSDFYRENERGLKIICLEDEYQLCTVEQNYRYVQALAEPRKKQTLSPAALETLSIVAYHQPVTRGSIEYIRGVNSDGPVNRLIERGLIEEGGRLDAPGRPILYVTTQEFLRSFGLSSLSELPDIQTGIGAQISVDNIGITDSDDIETEDMPSL